ncbi:MAG: transposase [Aggregatilineales bacterium]
MNTIQDLVTISRQNGSAERAVPYKVKQLPWSHVEMDKSAQSAKAAWAELTSGTMLVLDGRNNKVEANIPGVIRQYAARADKDTSEQVGISVWLVQGASWGWVDGGLCLSEVLTTDGDGAERRNIVLPTEQRFAAKAQLGIELFERIRARGVPFEAVTCDAFYGRDGWFRAELDTRQFQYMVDVPPDQRVYLTESIRDLSANVENPVVQDSEILAPRTYRADQLCCHPQTEWHRLSIRITERYILNADFAARRVQTVWQAKTGQLHTRHEWLVMRRNAAGKCEYALSNAPVETSLAALARCKAQHFFID